MDIFWRSLVRMRAQSREGVRLLDSLRGKHRGQSVAVLGGGPSLGNFEGRQDVAIAVNGAALLPRRYDYFLCGDESAPKRSWFQASAQWNATRVVSSFVAPWDPLLFPDSETRLRLQAALPLRRTSTAPFYEYEPNATVSPPHIWFQYEHPPVSRFHDLPFDRNAGRFFHGATIAGAAVQLAAVMGAAEIHLFGCDFSNRTGLDYFLPTKEAGGVSSQVQIDSFAKVLRQAEKLGIHVVRPQPL